MKGEDTCGALLALLVVSAAPGARAGADNAIINYERAVLANGLEVIVHEDHRAPLAAFSIAYKVGAADDPPGRAGLAHLLEHLTFLDSKHLPDGRLAAVLQKAGVVEENGVTSRDLTRYHAVLPANRIETAFWVESERLAFFLGGRAPTEHLNTARHAVKNERVQRFDNVTAGRVQHFIDETFFPLGHPYRSPSVGEPADLDAVTADEAIAFFSRHYRIDNAVLVVAGDVETKKVQQLAQKYFGTIPRGAPTPARSPAPPLPQGERRVVIEARGARPHVLLRFAAPPAFAPDHADSILGFELLFRALEREAARPGGAAFTTVNRSVTVQRLETELLLSLWPAPGQTLAKLTAEVDAELDRVCPTGGANPSELTRVKGVHALHRTRGLDGLDARADALTVAAVLGGSPAAFAARERRYAETTPQSVCTALRRTIAHPVRLVAFVEPVADAPVAGRVRAQRPAQGRVTPVPMRPLPPPPAPPEDGFRQQPPALGEAPLPRSPSVVRFTLKNGLEVLLSAAPELPYVELAAVVENGAGSERSPAHLLSFVGVMMADAQTATHTRDSREHALGSLGAAIDFGFEWEVTRLKLMTTASGLALALPLWSELFTSPTFNEPALAAVKQRWGRALEAEGSATSAMAERALRRALYPDGHPFARVENTASALPRVRLQDVQRHHHTSVVPTRTKLIVVGNTTAAELRPLLEKTLGTWKARTPTPAPRATAPPPTRTELHLVDRAGAPQAVIQLGAVGPPRASPDYEAVRVLGWLLDAEVNGGLRHKRGWSYSQHFDFDPTRGPHPLSVRVSVATENAAASVHVLLHILRQLATKPLDAAYVRSEAAELVAKLLGKSASRQGAMAAMTSAALNELGDRSLETTARRLAAVTPEDVRRVAARYFHPDHLAIVVVGDRARLATGLAEIGRVKLRDPDGALVSAGPKRGP